MFKPLIFQRTSHVRLLTWLVSMIFILTTLFAFLPVRTASAAPLPMEVLLKPWTFQGVSLTGGGFVMQMGLQAEDSTITTISGDITSVGLGVFNIPSLGESDFANFEDGEWSYNSNTGSFRLDLFFRGNRSYVLDIDGTLGSLSEFSGSYLIYEEVNGQTGVLVNSGLVTVSN